MSAIPPMPPQPPLAYASATQPQFVPPEIGNLKILAIFYWIFGGIECLLALLMVFYAFMFVLLLSADPKAQSIVPVLLVVFGGLFLVFAASAVVNFLAAAGMPKGRRYTLCLVAAGINCLSVPLGTILGVFTFIALAKPVVKAHFGRPA